MLKYLNPIAGFDKSVDNDDDGFPLLVVIGVVLSTFIIAAMFVFWSYHIVGLRVLVVSLLATYSANIYYYKELSNEANL